MRNIWIYGVENFLSDQQIETIQGEMKQFLANWKAHGTPVPATAEVKYDRFLIVRAHPGSTSGCSIDDMNRNVTAILDKVGATILEPNIIFFRDGGAHVNTIDFRELEDAIGKGWLDAETLVFDNSISDQKDFDRWEVRLKDTWMNRYLPVAQ